MAARAVRKEAARLALPVSGDTCPSVTPCSSKVAVGDPLARSPRQSAVCACDDEQPRRIGHAPHAVLSLIAGMRRPGGLGIDIQRTRPHDRHRADHTSTCDPPGAAPPGESSSSGRQSAHFGESVHRIRLKASSDSAESVHRSGSKRPSSNRLDRDRCQFATSSRTNRGAGPSQAVGDPQVGLAGEDRYHDSKVVRTSRRSGEECGPGPSRKPPASAHSFVERETGVSRGGYHVFGGGGPVPAGGVEADAGAAAD
jgi:hypothetical protein